MAIFITGTDTNIGKTLIASWLCLHTGAGYFKPIQTGSVTETDTKFVARLTPVTIHPEKYLFPTPVSPHLAAQLANATIELQHITLPSQQNLIVEGAGGVLVPLNHQYMMSDLIKQLQIPVLIIASSQLGTINHTCLTLAALRQHNIHVLGIIMNGPANPENKKALEIYGKTQVLAEFLPLETISTEQLKNRPLPALLTKTIASYL